MLFTSKKNDCNLPLRVVPCSGAYALYVQPPLLIHIALEFVYKDLYRAPLSAFPRLKQDYVI